MLLQCTLASDVQLQVICSSENFCTISFVEFPHSVGEPVVMSQPDLAILRRDAQQHEVMVRVSTGEMTL